MNSNFRRRAFVAAADTGSYSLTKILVKSVRHDQDALLSVYLKAAAHGRDRIAKLMIKSGVQRDEYNEDGYNALHLAVLNGELKTMEVLLRYGVDIDYPTRDGLDTPLHLIAGGHTQRFSLEFRTHAAQLLMDEGADINAVNVFESSPLHDAICHIIGGYEHTNEHVARMLIRAGAELLRNNTHGETPLTWAHVYQIEILVPELFLAEQRAKNIALANSIAVPE